MPSQQDNAFVRMLQGLPTEQGIEERHDPLAMIHNLFAAMLQASFNPNQMGIPTIDPFRQNVLQAGAPFGTAPGWWYMSKHPDKGSISNAS